MTAPFVVTTPEKAPEAVAAFEAFDKRLGTVMFAMTVAVGGLAASLVPLDTPVQIVGFLVVSVLFGHFMRVVRDGCIEKWIIDRNAHNDDGIPQEIKDQVAARLTGSSDPIPEPRETIHALRQNGRNWPYDGSLQIDREGK